MNVMMVSRASNGSVACHVYYSYTSNLRGKPCPRLPMAAGSFPPKNLRKRRVTKETSGASHVDSMMCRHQLFSSVNEVDVSLHCFAHVQAVPTLSARPLLRPSMLNNKCIHRYVIEKLGCSQSERAKRNSPGEQLRKSWRKSGREIQLTTPRRGRPWQGV